MINKVIIIFCFITIELYASNFFSASKSFQEKLTKRDTVTLKKEGEIYFKNEEVINTGLLKISSNNNKVNIKIQNIKKSSNLRDIMNSNIFIVINKIQKYTLSSLTNKNISLSTGLHKIHIEIKRNRRDIKYGNAKINFDIITSN